MPYKLINGRLIAAGSNALGNTGQRQPDEPSLLGAVGNSALSGLGMAGNLLDLPGSMIRDTLSGHNPFDQLLTPLRSDNRSYGRDILSNWGILDRNKETGMSGWLDDPTEGARDLGGFAFDVLTDPLTFLTLGASS